ncbi:hypothetical protein M405DRAFT_807160, partial [Rhizopogon salebrosus TDB-379]
TSTSTLQWMPHFFPFSTPTFPTSTPSTSTLPASATPISRPTPTLSPSHHQILDLQADIKEVLKHVVASHQEQKSSPRMSKCWNARRGKIPIPIQSAGEAWRIG